MRTIKCQDKQEVLSGRFREVLVKSTVWWQCSVLYFDGVGYRISHFY